MAKVVQYLKKLGGNLQYELCVTLLIALYLTFLVTFYALFWYLDAQYGSEAKYKYTTGLTGLAVSKNPRETLISVYNKTLDALSTMPDTATYRTSTENLTKQRMKLVEMEANIEELEKKIGCGQIEEVIEQANDELSLAQKMREWQPWEPLQTEAPADQWKWPIGKST